MRHAPTLLALALGAVLLASPANAQVRFNGSSGDFAVKVMTWRDIPFRGVVRQQYDYSCGSAALATLLRHHYAVPVGEAEPFAAMWEAGDQAKIRKLGFSLLDMKRYLNGRGYQADGFRISLDDLAQAKTPAIALIDLGAYRHFVVIKGVRGDEVLVGDPALGLKRYPRAEFEKMWNGVVLAVREAPRPATFNRPDEWRPWARAPLHAPLSDASLATFTRELVPQNQITPIFRVP